MKFLSILSCVLLMSLTSVAETTGFVCPTGLRVFLKETTHQDGDQGSCATYFLNKVRGRDISEVTKEFDLLVNRADKNIVMGLLVLAKNSVDFEKSLSDVQAQFEETLNKVTKKTKKTSDAYVLKLFFKALGDRGTSDETVAALAESIQFKIPRQKIQRPEPQINMGALAAAPCLDTLNTTIMQILSNTPGAKACAVKMRGLLNNPNKKNQVVKEYEAFASKTSGLEFFVQADLVPHKSNKKTEDGFVQLSYKGVMKGVFDDVAKGKKLPKLRIARVLQVQGINLEDLNKGPLKKEAKTEKTKIRLAVDPALVQDIQDFKVEDTPTPAPPKKRLAVPQSLVDEIEDLKKSKKRKLNEPALDSSGSNHVELKVAPNLFKEASGFKKAKGAGKKPTLAQEQAALRLLRVAVAPKPETAKIDVRKPAQTYTPRRPRVLTFESESTTVQPKPDANHGILALPAKKVTEKRPTVVINVEDFPSIYRFLNRRAKNQVPKKADQTVALRVISEIIEAERTQGGKGAKVPALEGPVSSSGEGALSVVDDASLGTLSTAVPEPVTIHVEEGKLKSLLSARKKLTHGTALNGPEQRHLTEFVKGLVALKQTLNSKKSYTLVIVPIPSKHAKALRGGSQKALTAGKAASKALVPAHTAQASLPPVKVVLGPGAFGILKKMAGPLAQKQTPKKALFSNLFAKLPPAKGVHLLPPPAPTMPKPLALPAPKQKNSGARGALLAEIRGFDKDKLKDTSEEWVDDEDDDWFARPTTSDDSGRKKKALSSSDGSVQTPLATKGSKTLLALPAPEKDPCATLGLTDGLKRLRDATILESDKKGCAHELEKRLKSDFTDPQTLSAELLGFPARVRQGLMGFVGALSNGKKAANADTLVVKDLLKGDLSRYEEKDSGKTIALGWKKEKPSAKRQRAGADGQPAAKKEAKPNLAKPRWEKIRKTMTGKRSLKEHELIQFQRCTAQTPYEFLEAIDEGHVACAKLAERQWKKQGKEGVLKTTYDRVSDTRRAAVHKVIQARLKGPGAGKIGLGKADASSEKTFGFFLKDLQKTKGGHLAPKKKILAASCKNTLEESLALIVNTRYSKAERTACSEQLKRAFQDAEPRDLPSDQEVSLHNQYIFLPERLRGPVQQFVDVIAPGNYPKETKQQALKALLEGINPPKKRAAPPKVEEVNEDGLTEEEVFELEHEAGKCQTSVTSALFVLNADWAPQEIKKICATQVLSALNAKNHSPEYQELGRIGQSSPQKTKKLQTFLEAVKHVYEGGTLERVKDPRI